MDRVIQRAKNLILSPKSEWPVIAIETTSSLEILKQYLVYLIAIPALSQFLRSLFTGRIGFFSGLIWAIIYYVLAILALYVMAYVVHLLAPSFNAVKDDQAAFKLVAYSATPIFIASIFNIIPVLDFLVIFGLYGVYLFYVGLPEILKCPKEKTLIYTILSIVLMIAIGAVFSFISMFFLCAL
jgi:hypothetical protein